MRWEEISVLRFPVIEHLEFFYIKFEKEKKKKIGKFLVEEIEDGGRP